MRGFVLPANTLQPDHPYMGLVSRMGCDDGPASVSCGACDLLRSFWSNAFNGKRVTPVFLIEQFLCQQQFLRAHETSFLPGL